MKKVLVVMLLAGLAAAQAPAPQAGQPAGQPTPQAQPGAAQPAQGGAPPAQKKEIKDPAEYNAYVGALQQQDPGQKVGMLEQFLVQFPNSVMKEDAMEGLMATYQQMGNVPKAAEAAQRLLQVNPNHATALMLLAVVRRGAAEQGQNPQQNFAEARQFAERGLAALPNMPREEGISDADYNKKKATIAAILHSAAGFSALQMKDFAGAQQHLRAAVEANPNNIQDVYPLALAYLSAKPSDDVQGLFFIARAAALAQGAAQAQILDFGKKRYARYHGGEDGWEQVVTAARANPLPPQGFTVAPAPPPPTPAEIYQTTPLKQMGFAEFAYILGSQDQATKDKLWADLQKAPLAFKGKVLASSRTKLSLAATADAIDANRADVELTMAAPLPVRLVPKVGSDAAVQAKPAAFTPEPFVMQMTDGQLLQTGGAAPKKPAPKRRTKG